MTNEDKLKKYLIGLGAELLAEKLIAFAGHNKIIQKELELLALNNDPKKLFTKLKQQINGIKRSKRFIPWNEARAFTEELYQITHTIEKSLILSAPDLAFELIEMLFHIDKNLCERMDDSNGEIGGFYYSLAELWGKACDALEDKKSINLPEKIFELLFQNDYGSRDYIIQYSGNALGEEGLNRLEMLIKNNEKHFSNYGLCSLYESIADALGNVDKYIAVIQKYSVVNEITVCNIAERLIAKWRSAEAIDWLLHQPDDIGLKNNLQQYDPEKVIPSKRYDMLLKAYDAETMTEETQSLRWLLFQQTLSSKYYEDLLKYQNTENQAKIKSKAFTFACENYKGEMRLLLAFLADIQEYEKLNDIIISEYENLNARDYSFYRPLSKNLATAGYFLSACLLRRELVNGILGSGQSKYYKYAVSDLKISQRYAESVNDWKKMPDHEKYMALLKNQHPRKAAFWSLVEQNNNAD